MVEACRALAKEVAPEVENSFMEVGSLPGSSFFFLLRVVFISNFLLFLTPKLKFHQNFRKNLSLPHRLAQSYGVSVLETLWICNLADIN